MVSKFWWVEQCLGTPIYNKCKTHGRGSRKKNFSEYLVDSKSCCTFAFATQKRGVPEQAWQSDRLEVSDTVSGEMYDG